MKHENPSATQEALQRIEALPCHACDGFVDVREAGGRLDLMFKLVIRHELECPATIREREREVARRQALRVAEDLVVIAFAGFCSWAALEGLIYGGLIAAVAVLLATPMRQLEGRWRVPGPPDRL